MSAFLADSVLMAAGFAGTAATGFVFWWIAAHAWPASAVGLASAAISAAGLIVLAAEFGLGPLLIGELPRRAEGRAGLVMTALALSGFAAFAIGAFVLATTARLGPPDLQAAAVHPALATMFLVGSVLATISSVLDQALIGLLRARLQMARGLVFGGTRLVPLAALAIAGWSGGPIAIVASWLVGLAIPLALGAILAGDRARIWPRPALLQSLAGRAAAHHLMTAAIQAPMLALPVVAAVLLGTATAAPFYASLMGLSATVILPASFAMRYQVAEGGIGQGFGRLRVSLAVSFACAAAAILVFAVLSTPLLRLLGPGYPAIVDGGLTWLGVAACGLVVKYHYLAIARVAGRLVTGGALLGGCALAEVAAAAAGAAAGGLAGLVAGWIVALGAASAVLAPTIVRAASGRG